MSKLAALSVAGTGATAIAVGGTYVMQRNGGGNTDQLLQQESNSGPTPEGSTGSSKPGESESQGNGVSSTPTSNAGGAGSIQGTVTSQPAKELKFSDLSSFKDKKGYKCSTSLFGDNDLDFDSSDSGITELSSTAPANGDFFGTVATGADKVKSCLIINGEKKTYSSDKWSGTFTGTGSFVNDNKGFVVVNIAKTDTTSKKLNLTGGAYLLEKGAGNDQSDWKIKYKKEVNDGKEINSSNFDKFLKSKSDSGVSVGTGDTANYGGFMQGQDDLNNICDSTSCSGSASGTPAELEEFEWSWKQGGNKKVSEWSENLNGGDYMFENSSFNLGDKLDSFTGTGNKVTPTK